MGFQQHFSRYKWAWAWALFVFILSTLPGKDFPKFDWGDLFSIDKMVHLLFYAILTVLILRGGQKIAAPKTIIGAAVLSLTYGWALEFYQAYFCEDRLFEFLDGVANTLGAILAAVGYAVWVNRNGRT